MSEMFPEKQVIPQDERMRAFIESEDWTAAQELEEELIYLRETAEE